MSNRKFTEEELRILRENPNTYRVSENTISFTKEFKAKFYTDYLNGKLAREILRENGYCTDLFGRKRIEGIKRSIIQQHQIYGQFRDARLKPGTAKKDTDNLETSEDQIKELRSEVEYLKQEMEFLKKISSIRTTKG